MEENKVYGKISFEDGTVGTVGTVGTTGNTGNIGTEYESKFKVSGSSNLPAKPSFFTRLKNVLFYEIKVELTPYEQKIEDEINEFLHQEVTWQSFKNFLFKEVEITHKGKRIL